MINKNKTIAVIGGSSGIGLTTSELLYSKGYNVLIGSRREVFSKINQKFIDVKNKIRSKTFNDDWKEVVNKLEEFENVFKYFNRYMYNISYSNNINVIKYHTDLEKGIIRPLTKKWNNKWKWNCIDEELV